MKKAFCVVLSLCLCFTLVACGMGTKAVKLTPENINNYLAFEIKLEEVMRYETVPVLVAGQENEVEEEPSGGFASCDVVLDVFSKSPTDYADVKITFDIVPSRNEYTSIRRNELQLKYDGTAQKTYKYECEVEGDNPEFEVVVTDVTGVAFTKRIS